MKTPIKALPSKRINQAGFSHMIAIAAVVAAFAAIGFIGYKLYAHPLHPSTAGSGLSAASRPAGMTAADAPQIKNTGDLDKASSVLDQVDVSAEGASDASQLDTQVNAFAN